MGRITRLTAVTLGSAVLLSTTDAAIAAPNPKPGLPDGVQAKLDTLLGMGMSVVIVACVAGVLLCAGQLAIAIRHGNGAEAAGKLGAVGFACILVGSGASIVNYLI